MPPKGISWGVDKPAGWVDQPAGLVDKSARFVDKPAGLVDKPTGLVGKPAGLVDKPAGLVVFGPYSSAMSTPLLMGHEHTIDRPSPGMALDGDSIASSLSRLGDSRSIRWCQCQGECALVHWWPSHHNQCPRDMVPTPSIHPTQDTDHVCTVVVWRTI